MSSPEMFASRLALPVSWDELSHPPSPKLRDTVARANADVLRFLLHGVDLEAMPRPADERLFEALAPLRAKLDMIIEMLGRLSYRDVELPPLCDIELNPTRIAWLSPEARRPGDWLRIKLYFHPTFREPVVVFAKVTSCMPDDRQQGRHTAADLTEMPEGIGENVARLSLLTQRRQRVHRPVPTTIRREECFR